MSTFCPHQPEGVCPICRPEREAEYVAIVGSRNYSDLGAVEDFVATLPKGTVVVSGGAGGVDHTAELSAVEHGLDVVSIPAAWVRHGKAAGFIRNRHIVKIADRVVAFWDGKSRGTANTVALAKEAGKPCEVRTSKPGGSQ